MRCALVLALALLWSSAAPAQVFNATSVSAAAKLQGNWRFQTGDDPRWASPAFDDSNWRLISTERNWDQQGLQHTRGYMWYRAKIKLPAQHGPLALLVKDIGPYEVYVNGEKVGSLGHLPPPGDLYSPVQRVYALPPTGSDATIAIRFWINPVIAYLNNFASDLLVGTKADIQRRYESGIDTTLVEQLPRYVSALFQLLLCGVLVVLFSLQRERKEYLYLALALAGVFLGTVGDIAAFVPIRWTIVDFFNILAVVILAMCLIEFVFRFIGQQMPVWARIYQFSMPLLILVMWAFYAGWLSNPTTNAISLIFLTPWYFGTPGLLLWSFARGNREAGLLAIPLFPFMLSNMLSTLSWILFVLHLRASSAPFIGNLHLGRISIGPEAASFFFFLISIAVLILIRFQQTRVDQARAHAELEAARSIQKVMVPRAVTAAGFTIETAYIPAQEVGGDFFQVFPAEDGSLLVVIGDVSGKGMKAAMLVSMIVGLLRSIVEDTHSPARVLSRLNRLLVGNMDGHFATCCCALMRPDGSVAAANAGHLAPYCDGKEVEFPGGLPLGVAADVEYEEITLSTGRRWIFLSDGVVEARSKSGELYGFERTRTVSVQAANEIAQSAQSFGQEDDITVLGIALQGVRGIL
jgi:phosphoserine phosphatase RsbU/P